MRSLDDWHTTCLAGADLFRREFLSDVAWEKEARDYYDLPSDVARLAMEIAMRAVVAQPLVTLSVNELRCLVPERVGYEAEVLDLLTSGGLFVVAPHVDGDR